MIGNDANVNQADNSGRTPLYLAAKAGHKEIVESLIKKGVDVNQADSDGWTPLHWAIEKGHKEVVELLIKNGADMDTRNFARLLWCMPEDITKLVIGLMNDSDRPYLLELLKLFKAKDLDKQVKMWCESKVLRDYCITPEVWKDKYPDLVNKAIYIS